MLAAPSSSALLRKTLLRAFALWWTWVFSFTTVLSPALAGAVDGGFEQCRQTSSSDLAAAIRLNVESQLDATLREFDYEEVILKAWRDQGMDTLIAELAQNAHRKLEQERSYVERLASNYSPDFAQQLTQEFNKYVYDSPEFQERVGLMFKAASEAISARIDRASLESHDFALGCIRSFLSGNGYSSAIAEAVMRALEATGGGAKFAPERVAAGAGPGTGKAVISTGAAIVAIVMQKAIARVITKIAGRIAGRLLGKAIPIAGWVWMVIELVYGANNLLDDLQSQLTSEETKKEFRTAFAEELRVATQKNSKAAAEDAARAVNAQWSEFKTRYRRLLALTESDEEFRAIFAAQSADRFEAVARVVDLTLRSDGEAGLKASLSNGSFEQALRLSDTALTIAEISPGGLKEAEAWTLLAGPSLKAVLDNDLPKYAQAEKFTPKTLDALLSVGSPSLMAQIAQLDRRSMEAVLTLPKERLLTVTRLTAGAAAPDSTIAVLAQYLHALKSPDAVNRLIAALERRPALIYELAASGMRQDILASNDQAAAVEMITRDTSAWNPLQAVEDFDLTRSDRIPLTLFLRKYFYLTAVSTLAAVMILLRYLNMIIGWFRPKNPAAAKPRGG